VTSQLDSDDYPSRLPSPARGEGESPCKFVAVPLE